jgi:hypothetical protein
MVMSRRMTALWVALLLIAAALLSGCRESEPPAPPTFAATGIVTWKNGTPLNGGIIQFVSQRDPTLNMSSPIGGDGRFALQTIVGNRNLAGAIEGPCQVLVTLPFAGVAEPTVVVLPQAHEITPQANDIKIVLDRNA